MLVIFQCDDADHVEVAHRIVRSAHWPAGCRAELLLLDRQGDLRRRVTQQIERLDWDVPCRDAVEDAPAPLRADLRNAAEPDLSDILVVAVFEALKAHLGSDDVALVQFDDASLRGQAVAAACRRMGIARLLVQNGFPTFRSTTGDLAAPGRNNGWGSSRPDHVAVWGPAMRQMLVDRHRLPRAGVRVTGPVLDLARVRQPRTAAVRGAPARVLWAGQPMTDQGRAEPSSDRVAEFGRIGAALARHDTTLRLHPSTGERTRDALVAVLPPGIRLEGGDEPLRAEDLPGYDCIVTSLPTVVLRALSAGVPAVFVRARSFDLGLPGIEDPLLIRCDDAAGLEEAIARAMAATIPEVPSVGFREHVSADDGFDGVAGMLAEILAEAPQEAAGASWTGLPYPETVALRRLQGRRILVLGTAFGRHAGVGKPVISLRRELAGSGVALDFHLVRAPTERFLLASTETASMVLVNSLDVVRTLTRDAMRRLVDRCEAAGTPLLFYIHETEHVFDRRRRELPDRFNFFLGDVLPRASCLAVSDRQAEWLAGLGARRIRVVYNSIGRSEPIARGEPDGTTRVVMVGTRQARKGVELFSRVADLAAEGGLDWRFEWLGPTTTESDFLYHSPRVHWHGQVSEAGVRETLGRTSCFFLSSIDDPMPLSVGEALAAGVPSLVYRETGFSDFIAHSRAGDVFDLYEPSHVLAKLRDLLEGRRRTTVVPEEVLALVGASAFARRCVVALGEEILPSRQPHPSGSAQPSAAPARRAWAGASWLSPGYVLRRTKITRAARAVLPVSLTKPAWRLGKRLGIL